MEAKSVNKKKQTAEDIIVLKGLQAVWQNPARFIGDVSSRGMHHLVDELVVNSIDEAMNGYCTRIDVVMHSNNAVTVSDNGRGIPTELHSSEKKSALEVVLTTLDAGGKMKKSAYDYSGGLHGVGLSVVNALSEFLEVEVKRDGKKFFQRYEYGKPVTPLKIIGKTDKTGTSVTFKPDEKFFFKTKYKSTIISTKLRDFAFINKGLTITFKEEGTEEEFYYFPQGIKMMIEEMNEGTSVVPKEAVVFSGLAGSENDEQKNEAFIDFAWQYNDTNYEKVRTYVNSVNTVLGGTHEAGFKSGISKAINDFAENKLKQKRLDSDYIREGLTGAICVKIKRPEFESQTKTRLTSPWVRNIVHKFVYESVSEYLENNPAIGKEICERALLAFKASEAAKKARTLVRRKGLLEKISSIPGKIADCEVKDTAKSEIFIVEGDSAGGSAKQARDRKTQAILPLKGKILNVEKKNINEILKNEEINILIQALGCGVQSSFDISMLRYGKIIIMTDADSDGSHIRTLLLTFFYRTMPELIRQGHVYIAQPPLYRIKYGNKHHYLKNDEALYDFMIKIVEKNCAVVTNNGKSFKAKELKDIFISLIKYGHLFKYLDRKMEKLIVDYFLRSTTIRKESLLDTEGLSFLKKELESYIKLLSKVYPSITPLTLDIDKNKEDSSLIVTFSSERRGRKLKTIFNDDFMKSPEFSDMDKESRKLKILGNPPYYIELIDKGKAIQASDIFDLWTQLMDYSKTKIDIQRYKGLGEMNPDQLWETTMNPLTRNVSKVDIDDEEAADNLTSILMGDAVTSRKHFIDVNALNVRNLDI
jgi:DNA gyrase subunit B